MSFEEYWLMREVGTGIVAFLLAVITYALSVFIYDHRITVTVQDREARDAAIGLVVIFASLMVRAGDLWLSVVAERLGWVRAEEWAGEPWLYLVALAGVVIGVVLTVKAFHPWPLWAMLVGAAVAIPIGVSFL